jgi:hypothetical protein
MDAHAMLQNRTVIGGIVVNLQEKGNCGICRPDTHAAGVVANLVRHLPGSSSLRKRYVDKLQDTLQELPIMKPPRLSE